MTRIQIGGRRGPHRGYATVDDVDAGQAAFNWWLNKASGYVMRREGAGPAIFLHREIARLPAGDPREVDHRDGDHLNCRRGNLIVVTHAQNSQNRRSDRGSSSRYRGVSWDKSRQKWLAHGTLNGRFTYLGRFDNEDDAAEAARQWRLDSLPFTNESRVI